MEQIELTVLFGLISVGIAILTFFIGRQTTAKSEGQTLGVILTKLDNIEKKVDKQEDVANKALEIAIEANQRAKSAHGRIDEVINERRRDG